MQLFKRLLLSFFPDSLVKDSFNPASMFVSFISAKDFFTVIDRKIIENYKLNLFDLSMDIFEWKLWLWNNKNMIQSKMADTYYSYIAAANFNWYKFYNIWNTANALTLMSSMYLYDSFSENENRAFINALYTFYLLSFIFSARIKVFPWKDTESDFNWFIDLYFNFYEIVLSQLKHEISTKNIHDIKNKMLNHIDIFFMMFYYYKRTNTIFITKSKNSLNRYTEFYQRLFWPQLTPIQKDFLNNYENITSNSQFWVTEQNLIFDIIPIDIHLKYIFLETDTSEIISNLISSIFDKKLLEKRLTWIMKNESELDFIIDYVTNPNNFKKWFFKWVRQYISHIRLENKDSYDELDEMISEIWDDINKLDQMQIPASIKKESMIMEQFLNFYISYIWWLSISRADTFFFRLFKPKLIPELIQHLDIQFKTDEAINFAWKSHLAYTKNSTYYQFVQKKIKSWKEKFFIPITPIKTEPIKATAYLMQSMDEIALITLLQDCNPRINKLYIKNKALLDRFQAQYSTEITPLIQDTQNNFVYSYYEHIFSNFYLWKNILKILENAYTEQDIIRLKDSLYIFDVQLFREIIKMFPRKKFKNIYSDNIIIQHLALIRETILWFLIYYQYLQLTQKSWDKLQKLDLSLFKKIYILNILNRDESLLSTWLHLIDTLLEQFWIAFSTFVELDDNKEFFLILKENRIDFISKLWKKSELEKLNSFSMEDILRLRWVFKHITYYNKRYLIPN